MSQYINRSNIKYAIGVSWVILGFSRGIQSYNYSNRSKSTGDTQLYVTTYVDKLLYGIGGSLVYVNPVMFPFMVYKEMYRMEVNIRGIESLKNTDYYKEVI